jgi:hypothetical protein
LEASGWSGILMREKEGIDGDWGRKERIYNAISH